MHVRCWGTKLLLAIDCRQEGNAHTNSHMGKAHAVDINCAAQLGVPLVIKNVAPICW